MSNFASVLAALLLSSCAGPVHLKDVPGTYVMDHGRAADTLTVRPDGHYARVYLAPGHRAAIDTGTWTVDTTQGQLAISFTRFVARWRAETFPTAPQNAGLWVVEPIRTRGGTLRLTVDDDLGWAYVQRRGGT